MSTNNPRLIRLVAGNYAELQGLSTIADAGLPLIVAAGYYLLTDWWQAPVFLAVLAFYYWARLTWVHQRLEDYYERRCGRTTPRSIVLSNNTLTLVSVIGLAWGLRDFHMPLLQVVVTATMLSAIAMWIVVRDFPYRLHWLGLVAVGCGWALRLPGLTTNADAYAWQFKGLLAVAAALIVAGLFDHALLMRVLNPAEAGELAAGYRSDDR